tara:strand:+ start:1868 stop:2221 length:354 start_codon:yes stop_codon:yes gene_type:complete
MGTKEDVIEEEGKRLLGDYFNEGDIKSAEDPIKEMMKQARKTRGFGILEEIGRSPKLASQLLGVPLKARRWSRADIGKVKSARTRGASLVKLSRTLGRTANSTYKLIGRLKKKGEVQ